MYVYFYVKSGFTYLCIHIFINLLLLCELTYFRTFGHSDHHVIHIHLHIHEYICPSAKHPQLSEIQVHQMI